MKYIFNKYLIFGNEIILYTFLGIMSLIILITIFLIIKEVKKNEYKWFTDNND